MNQIETKAKKTERNVLKIDVDRPIHEWGWLPDFEKAIVAVLNAFNYSVNNIVSHPSTSGKGLHLWIHIQGPPLTDEEKNKFQALCYDDWGRVWINRIRIQHRTNPNWNKMFSEVSYRRPIDEKCRECRLYKLIRDLEEKV